MRETLGIHLRYLLDSLYILYKYFRRYHDHVSTAQDSSLGLAANARFFSSTEATHHLGYMTLNVMQTMSCEFNACEEVMCS